MRRGLRSGAIVPCGPVSALVRERLMEETAVAQADLELLIQRIQVHLLLGCLFATASPLIVCLLSANVSYCVALRRIVSELCVELCRSVSNCVELCRIVS